MGLSYRAAARCISYYSYIKPQPKITCCHNSKSCISYYSYIKPQLDRSACQCLPVVYRTIPTSNHNLEEWGYKRDVLYIVLFLHQTTTVKLSASLTATLYIVLFLHQTTTFSFKGQDQRRCISYYSYIKPQPCKVEKQKHYCCISYYSYIKPQHLMTSLLRVYVVYRTIPTSNHNPRGNIT